MATVDFNFDSVINIPMAVNPYVDEHRTLESQDVNIKLTVIDQLVESVYNGVLRVVIKYKIPRNTKEIYLEGYNIQIKLNGTSIPTIYNPCSLTSPSVVSGRITKTSGTSEHAQDFSADAMLSNNNVVISTNDYNNLIDINLQASDIIDISKPGTRNVKFGSNNDILHFYDSDPDDVGPMGQRTFEITNNKNILNYFNFDFIVSGIEPRTYFIEFYKIKSASFLPDYTIELTSKPDDTYIDTIYNKITSSHTSLPLTYKTSVSNTSNTIFYETSSYNTKIGTLQNDGVLKVTTNYKQRRSNNHCRWFIGNNSTSTTTVDLDSYSNPIKFTADYEIDSTSIDWSTSTLKLPSTFIAPPYRKGYTTNGNYLDSQGRVVSTGQAVTSDMIISSTNYDVRLYLDWTAIKYNINFLVGDGGTWETTPQVQITKTFGTKIKRTDSLYPKNKVTKTGYIQYGWVPGRTGAVGKNSTNAICTYTYNHTGYDYTQEDIDDKWYVEGQTNIDVSPCWEPITHKVKKHYYVSAGSAQKLEEDTFDITNPYKSYGEPINKSGLSSNWQFLGWVQGSPPKGSGWEWGSGGSDIRNYGTFRYMSDLKDIEYSPTYGINLQSLTSKEWSNWDKNIDLYGLWSINSRLVFIGNEWRRTDGIWIYKDGEWKPVEDIYYYKNGWKQEVNS